MQILTNIKKKKKKKKDNTTETNQRNVNQRERNIQTIYSGK